MNISHTKLAQLAAILASEPGVAVEPVQVANDSIRLIKLSLRVNQWAHFAENGFGINDEPYTFNEKHENKMQSALSEVRYGLLDILPRYGASLASVSADITKMPLKIKLASGRSNSADGWWAI